MMKMLIIVSLTALSGCKGIYCKTTPKIGLQERCFVSFQFRKCRCVMFDLMTMSEIGPGYDKPIQYCEDFGGFHFDDWKTSIRPWANESRRSYEDYCVK